MKRICTVIIGLLVTGIAFSQPSITAVYFPQYMQGVGSLNAPDDRKVPYVCRATINGLDAGKTYRCYNRFVTDTSTAAASSNGDGNYIVVKQSARFYRMTSPSLSGANTRYIEFTTDASGSYTGWFASEATSAQTFAPGNKIYFRLMINDGTVLPSATVGAVKTRISATSSPITVINFGPGTSPNTGTGVRSTPAASGMARNFVMLYDNTAGTGRPVAGTFIESDTTDNTVANGYVPFYANYVNAVDKAWGTIIPNNIANGIQKIVQYSLATGVKVGSKSSSNGIWAKEGGGTVDTKNYNGADTLVLDGTAVPLGPPVGQTITFNSFATKTYGDAAFDAGATATSGLPVTYSSSNTAVADTVRVNGQLYIAIKGAGFTDVTAKQSGDDDFGAATDVTQRLTIDKANLHIKAADKFWVLGTAKPALTVIYTGFVYTDDENVLNPKPNVTTTADATSPIGKYAIKVDNAGSPNYNISYDTGTISVVSNKQPQTISFNPLPGKVYGAADFDPGARASSTLPVQYASSNTSVAIIVNNKIQIKGAGTTTITASQPGDLTTYEPAPDSSLLFTVSKAPLTIRVNDTTRLIGQPNPSFRLTYSGFVYGDNNTHLLAQPVVTTAANAGSPAGKYLIEVRNAASNNYNITYSDGELTVDAKQAQTIQFAALPVKKYGDAYFKAGAKASSGLTVTYTSSNTNVATVANDTIYITGVGSTDITASQSGNAFYASAANVTQTLTVQKPVLTIKANNKIKNEGQPNPPLTVTYSGFVNNDDSSKLATLPAVTTTATTNSLAGTYVISVEGATSPNYIIRQQDATLTVLPAQGEGQDNMYAYISSPGQLQVNVHSVNTAKASIQLFDGNGSRLINTVVTLTKGFNTYRIPIGNVTPGIYNVRVAGSGIMLKTKVVIRP